MDQFYEVLNSSPTTQKVNGILQFSSFVGESILHQLQQQHHSELEFSRLLLESATLLNRISYISKLVVLQ